MMIWEKTKNVIYFFLNIFDPLAGLFLRLPRVSILMYHSISDSRVLFSVSVEDFTKQLEFLRTENYRVISLGQLVAELKNKEKLIDKTVVLTFDDGYEDNFLNVWPLLKKDNFPATIFLPSAFIGRSMNNSVNSPIKMMEVAQIKEMADFGLVEFGSHTHSHVRLDKISRSDFAAELKTSKEIIENITRQPCRFIAYPKGHFCEDPKEAMQKAGFSAGFTVKEGLVRKNDNLFLLKRNFIYSAGGFSQFKGKLTYSVLIYNALKTLF